MTISPALLVAILLALVHLAAPLVAVAQPAEKVYRIGPLTSRPYPAMLDPFAAEMHHPAVHPAPGG